MQYGKKKIEYIKIEKWDIKLSWYADDINIDIENDKESTDKLLELIS